MSKSDDNEDKDDAPDLSYLDNDIFDDLMDGKISLAKAIQLHTDRHLKEG